MWGFPHRFKQYSRLFSVVNCFIRFLFMLPLEGDLIPFEWVRLTARVLVAVGPKILGGVVTRPVESILWR